MKIIVATNHFASEIKRALENKSESFEVIADKNEIVFSGKRTIYTSISPTIGDKHSTDNGLFNQLQWYKMMQFLNQLEEQPIVIEISGGDDPSFELTQFVKKF